MAMRFILAVAHVSAFGDSDRPPLPFPFPTCQFVSLATCEMIRIQVSLYLTTEKSWF